MSEPEAKELPRCRDCAQIKHMVDRFLQWKLPENFNPDGGISFKRTFNENTPWPMKSEPVGTNLFDATQAEAMVRYMVDGMPQSAEVGMEQRTQFELCPQCGISPFPREWCPMCEVRGERVVFPQPAPAAPEAPPQPGLDDPEAWEGINQELASGGDASPIGAEKRGPLGLESRAFFFLIEELDRRQLPVRSKQVEIGHKIMSAFAQSELARAESELAALEAENQRLREALEKLGHASSHLVWATGVEIGGGHRTRAFKVQHHAKCRYWMEQVEAALAEKGSK